MSATVQGGSGLATRVGALELANPIMTASGTSGHGTELAEYGALAELGAVVVKSLAVDPWPGNPAPRVHEVGANMLNSVGLQGPGLADWSRDDLPALAASGARVVVSIWGRTVEDYARAAERVTAAASSGPGACIVALEVNVSCPNVEDRSRMFAHSADATARVMAATECGLPRWAKLSPNVPDLVEIAAGALEAGAHGLTLVNTLLGLALDTETGRPRLGAGGGGLSGAAVHPVAVRAVWECRAAFPDVAIVGVGGVARGVDAVELLQAGADAVQVGTATFRDPRAPWKVLRQLARWCRAHGTSVEEIRAGARRRVDSDGGDVAVADAGDEDGDDNAGAPGARDARARPGKEDVMADSFGERVEAAARALGPLCAGIDPSAALLGKWGLSDDADGLRAFCRTCVEGFAGAVAVIKPQVAFFERHGAAGMAELERLIADAGAAGLIVIADAKRGDIDSTAEAYADAWLGAGSRLAADAVTAHAYLGLGALAPLVRVAAANGRGVLVVTRSSNPEGRSLQLATTAGGPSVEDMLLGEVAALNASEEVPAGTVGTVIGATLPPSDFPLSQLGGVILAPGLGAQGAGPAEVAGRFAGCRRGSLLPSSSRGLLNFGPEPADLRREALSLSRELAAALG